METVTNERNREVDLVNYIDGASSLYTNDYNVDMDEITADHPRAQQPPNCNITLKEHQLSLLYKCIDLENHDQKLLDYPRIAPFVKDCDSFRTSIGVIADRVGAGKSYVVLSLIASNNIQNDQRTIIKSTALNQLAFHVKDLKPVIKTNIIVVPHNLSSQWSQYLASFGCGLEYRIVNKRKFLELIKQEDPSFDTLDVIVVTATYYNELVTIINNKNVKVQRVFFDEVDSLNIPNCHRIPANFTWFITASYGNLLYPKGYSRYCHRTQRYVYCANGIRNAGFLKNVFVDMYANLHKDFSKLIMLKSSPSFLESSMRLPTMNMNVIKCKTPHVINVLHGLVDKAVIECLNAGDVTAAISHVSPSNKGSEDNIVKMLIDKYHGQIRNTQLRLNMTREMTFENERDRAIEISNMEKRMQEIQQKINAITERVKSSNMCSICFDDVVNKTITKCCQNSFCFACLHIWLSKSPTCPLCKSRMNKDSTFVVADDVPEVQESNVPDVNVIGEHNDKFTNFKLLMQQRKQNAKVLVCSNFDRTLIELESIMAKMNIKFDFIKGNGDQIRCIVDRYKTGHTDVLIVNTREYGSGLNLENTTDIVMFHKFDTQLEQQVIGRAQRMGRTGPLNIHYLLHENEIRA